MLNAEYKLLNIETQNEHQASSKGGVQSQEALCEAQNQRFKHKCKSKEIDVTQHGIMWTNFVARS